MHRAQQRGGRLPGAQRGVSVFGRVLTPARARSEVEVVQQRPAVFLVSRQQPAGPVKLAAAAQSHSQAAARPQAREIVRERLSGAEAGRLQIQIQRPTAAAKSRENPAIQRLGLLRSAGATDAGTAAKVERGAAGSSRTESRAQPPPVGAGIGAAAGYQLPRRPHRPAQPIHSQRLLAPLPALAEQEPLLLRGAEPDGPPPRHGN